MAISRIIPVSERHSPQKTQTDRSRQSPATKNADGNDIELTDELIKAAMPRPRPVQLTKQQRWQAEQQQAIRDPEQLLELLQLNGPEHKSLLNSAKKAAKSFPLRVPLAFAQRMHPGDINDPLLRQVLPLGGELEQHDGYSSDPVSDADALVAPGVLHKYSGRALLTLSPACGVHCRYCFRREFPYADNQPSGAQLDTTLAWLSENKDVQEVILSGGDPLMLSDDKLSEFVEALEDIRHIRRIRIHTRQPIVLPSRVDDSLLDWLGDTHLQTVVVLHCNHANEIDDEVYAAMDDLRSSGTMLLNQSVLLRDVNDNVDSLCELSEALFEGSTLPYYLNMLDKVTGSAHLEVEEQRAIEIVDGMRSRLPGFLVPRLVRDVPGYSSKTLIR